MGLDEVVQEFEDASVGPLQQDCIGLAFRDDLCSLGRKYSLLVCRFGGLEIGG